MSWLRSFSKLRFILISEKVSWTFINEMEYGIFPRDAIHVATMREVGIKEIATYDDDFDRVPNIIRWG